MPPESQPSHTEHSTSRFIPVTVRRTTVETYVIDREALAAEGWATVDLTNAEEVGDYVLDELETIEVEGLPFVHKLDGLAVSEDAEIAAVALDGRLEPRHDPEPDSQCEHCGTPTWGVVNDDEPICADCWAKPVLRDLAAVGQNHEPGDTR